MDESLVTCRICNFKADETKKACRGAREGKIQTKNFSEQEISMRSGKGELAGRQHAINAGIFHSSGIPWKKRI